MKPIHAWRHAMSVMLLLGLLWAMPARAAYDINMIIATKKGEHYTDTEELNGFHINQLGFYGINTLFPASESIWASLDFSLTPPISWTLLGTAYQSDTAFPIAFSTNGGYAFDPDEGIVDMDIPAGSQPGLEAYLSANRQAMIVRHATTDDPEGPVLKIGLALKSGSEAYGNGHLNGTYHFRGKEFLNFHAADMEASILWGTMTFDGNGEWETSLSLLSSSTGNVPVNVTAGGFYTVATNGALTLVFDGGPTLHGHLSADTEIFVLSIGEQVETEPAPRANSLLVGMKTANGDHAASDLDGDFVYSELQVYNIEASSAADRDGSVAWGTISFDGSGGFTGLFNALNAQTGTTASNNQVTGTYALATNGDLELTITERNGEPTTQIFNGHLSSDGQVMVLTRIEDVAAPDDDDGDDDDGSGGDGGSSGGGGSGGGGCFIGALW
ncbi:MAG: hypothetical protein KFF50_00220 [Desulfatitalea sp.]|nr:hypothetical protein [Desulfatitalea sp.]